MPTLVDLLNQNTNQRNGYWVYLNENPGAGDKESQTNKNQGEQKKTFKDQQSAFGPRRNLYGLAGTIFIESRGLVNPGRAAALLVSSPVPAADLIGGQVNGFLGGNSNRPDDTIFKNKLVFSKPITLLAPTQALLRDAVKEGQVYYIKPNPFPGNILKNVISAFSNPAAFVSMGAMAINKFGSKKALQKLADLLKRKGDPGGYGSKFGKKLRGESKKDDKLVVKYTENFTMFEPVKNKYTGRDEYVRKKGKDDLGGQGHAQIGIRQNTRSEDGNSKFDQINDWVLQNLTVDVPDNVKPENREKYIKDKMNSAVKASEYGGYTMVTIKLYGKSESIVLPGTISGISEDYAPEINQFKHIGSPFFLYKYGGVERTLKFDLKLYALEAKHEAALRLNLDRMRMLVYPDEDISVITYGNNAYSPMYFTPNLIELTVSGLYSNLLGMVDTLSIAVDDNVSWASTDFMSGDRSKANQHPTVFNVSFGMKVINRPSVSEKEDGGGYKFNFGSSKKEDNKYVNYFTGYNYFGEDKFKEVAASSIASTSVKNDQNTTA